MSNPPAKRAAYLLLAIGVVLLAVSFVSTMYALLRPEWVDAQLAPSRQLLEGNPLFERPALTWLIAVSGAMGLIESGLSIALGLYVLRGRSWAILTSLVLTILRLLIVGLFALLLALAAVVTRALPHDPADGSAASAPPSIGVWNIAGTLIATLVLIVLAVWLMQAMKIERRSKQQVLDG